MYGFSREFSVSKNKQFVISKAATKTNPFRGEGIRKKSLLNDESSSIFYFTASTVCFMYPVQVCVVYACATILSRCGVKPSTVIHLM